jgi:hypothetical protein
MIRQRYRGENNNRGRCGDKPNPNGADSQKPQSANQFFFRIHFGSSFTGVKLLNGARHVCPLVGIGLRAPARPMVVEMMLNLLAIENPLRDCADGGRRSCRVQKRGSVSV